MSVSACRFCGAALQHVFADLGMTPLANAFLSPERANAMEPFYPLRALVCGECLLVQLEEFETPQHIFGDYAYFSSYSTTWLDHARRYVDEMVQRFGIDAESRVVELASNDGYLLQYFQERGTRVLGIEPAANVADEAVKKGIPTRVEFFGAQTATALSPEASADLLVGNNVLAHVPDINDFVRGMKILLKPEGVITMEFPHLLRLIEDDQFDTIYHEHFSYLSFSLARRLFAAHGLRLFDVQEIPTHGGSLRIFGCHADAAHEGSDRPRELLERERDGGLGELDTYLAYAERVARDKRDIVSFFIDLKRQGFAIAGYGAPAKANTMLNSCGLGRDYMKYTVDRNPHKQGLLLPGTHIPIRPVEALADTRPDVVVILPWNLREEIVEQLGYVRDWGGRFAARTPTMTLFG